MTLKNLMVTLKNLMVNKKINIVIFVIALFASAGAKTKYGVNTTSEMWVVFLTTWVSTWIVFLTTWIQGMLIFFIGYKMFSWFKSKKTTENN